MKNYDTLSETMAHLQKKVYTVDFNLKTEHLECNALKLNYIQKILN